MKKFLIRLAKGTGILLVLLFITAFIWANWEEPGPGAKATVVNFLQYDASNIGDSSAVVRVEKTLKNIPGVRGTTYNATSKLLIVSYGIDDVDLETIESQVNQKHHITLKEKVFTKGGPKCPIDVAYISRVKHFLCVRD